jgi:integrase
MSSDTKTRNRTRGNGEGSIRSRPGGGYEARATLLDGSRKSRTFPTRQEAARWLAEAIRDRDKGIYPVPERQTLRQFLEQWIQDVASQLQPSSLRRYRDYVRVHLIPGLGPVTLAKLTAQQVQAFYTRKKNEGLSSTTVHHLHGVLHRALGDAERLGLGQRNVTEQAHTPRRSTQQARAMKDEEANRFLEVAQDDRFYALYVLALTTGMREGELLGLRWQDLDLDDQRPSLQVQVGVQEAEKGYILAEPKTTSSRRRIALTAVAVAALRQHHLRQAEERLRLGTAWDGTLNLVFPNAFGGVMIPHNLAKRGFKQLLNRAGLQDHDYHFHCLRHTAATLLLSHGVHPKVVSEMLGHADISITLRIYAHVTPTMQQAAVDTMQHVFGSRGA